MSNTVLVLGSNAGQTDLIRHMKSRGWRTVACAHIRNLPGEAIADAFEQVDVRDPDAVAELAKRVGADLVYSVSSDLAIKTAISVSERLGLPHFYGSGFIDLLDQKHKLRAHLNQSKLSEVAYKQVTSVSEGEDWSSFPCVVKPADAQGQRGVVVVNDRAELLGALDAAISLSPSKTAVVEAYLDGVEISSNVLVYQGEVVVNEVSERLVHGGHLFGIPRGHLVPCHNVSKDMRAAARQLVRDVVASLQVANGCLYFQMKITPDGPKIIEIAPRLDGCHMWRLIYHARGFDFLAATVDVLLGKAPDLSQRREDISLHELMFQQTPPGSIFQEVDFPVPANALYHEYRYTDGETVLPINGLMDVVGYYVRMTPADEVGKFDADKR